MNKKIQFVIMLLVALLIAIIIYYFDAAPNSYEFHKQFYKTHYFGVVDNVFIDAKHHQNKTIICYDVHDVNKTFRVRTPDANKRIFEIVSFRDTILKKPNSNEIIIIGQDEHISISYELKYP